MQVKFSLSLSLSLSRKWQAQTSIRGLDLCSKYLVYEIARSTRESYFICNVYLLNIPPRSIFESKLGREKPRWNDVLDVIAVGKY
jgi:hypothetical protein